jgi:hypothetical protein
MSAIGPGCWVECVDDPAWDYCDPNYAGPGPDTGGVYCVDFITEDAGVSVVALVEFPQDDGAGRWTYPTAGFRPVYDGKSDFIESLKRPAPADLVGV